MNTAVIVIAILAALALIIFLFIRNQKDKKELEQQLKNDFPHSTDSPGDIETDETMQ